MQPHPHVVIVGGAAIGSAAAYFLTSHPEFKGSVSVIEQDPSYQHCATTLSAASIRHQFSTPENIQMSQFGTEFLHQFAHKLEVNGYVPDPAFNEKGYLFLATPQGVPILKANHATQCAHGARIALLSPDQLATRYPWMNTSDLAAGSLGLAGEGWLDAYALMQGMRLKARAQGAQYVHDTVVDVYRNRNTITGVQLARAGHRPCDILINAAGTGSTLLAHKAGIDLPVESRKRSVFYVHCPTPLPDCPMVIDPSGAYFRPEGPGFIMGIAPAPDNDPACHDFDVQHTLFDETLWPILASRVPAFEALRVQRSWAGHYDMNTFDHNLILGAHPEVHNMLFANGLSGHGMQQSPAIGRALSELVIYGHFTTLDLRRMGWQRVLENTPLLELNVV